MSNVQFFALIVLIMTAPNLRPGARAMYALLALALSVAYAIREISR